MNVASPTILRGHKAWGRVRTGQWHWVEKHDVVGRLHAVLENLCKVVCVSLKKANVFHQILERKDRTIILPWEVLLHG